MVVVDGVLLRDRIVIDVGHYMNRMLVQVLNWGMHRMVSVHHVWSWVCHRV